MINKILSGRFSESVIGCRDVIYNGTTTEYKADNMVVNITKEHRKITTQPTQYLQAICSLFDDTFIIFDQYQNIIYISDNFGLNSPVRRNDISVKTLLDVRDFCSKHYHNAYDCILQIEKVFTTHREEFFFCMSKTTGAPFGCVAIPVIGGMGNFEGVIVKISLLYNNGRREAALRSAKHHYKLPATGEHEYRISPG